MTTIVKPATSSERSAAEKLSRRTVLAGVAASAVVFPGSSSGTPTDPVFEAYDRWKRAFDAFGQALQVANDHPIKSKLYDAALQRAEAVEGNVEWRAMRVLVDTVPLTLDGLATQLAFAEEFHLWSFGNWDDDLDQRLFNSIRQGVNRLNNRSA